MTSKQLICSVSLHFVEFALCQAALSPANFFPCAKILEKQLPQVKRSYLLLQGIGSPFISRLADRLVSDGHAVSKVNFNSGDTAYWGRRKSYAFKGKLSQLPAFLEDTCRTAGITDVVMLGDRLPIHIPAIEVARSLGLRTHVFEEGYFRPYWVTLERNGVNAHSQLPRDPEWYRRVSSCLPQTQSLERFQSPFRVRVMHAVGYNVASMLNLSLFPGYQTHSRCGNPIMYATGYVKRWALKPAHEKRDRATIAALVSSRIPYYFFPLQLDSDAQIRDHSRFENMADAMECVMESFARHAPSNSHLVIKNHPIDVRLASHSCDVRRLEQRFGLTGRVVYLETGNLETLVQRARGTITVNSTVGGMALQHNCPLITLSDPIYNVAGLTFQGPLDHFWRESSPPDQELYNCFRNVVIHVTQINGGFYCNRGISLAVENSIPSLTAERSRLEELL
jgi:capsular polysaccharide export protein